MDRVVSRYTEGDRGDGGYSFVCPGCGHLHAVPIGKGAGPRWGFNGSETAPTFTPSLLVRAERWDPPVTGENLEAFKRAPWPQRKVASICHSFVTDGKIRFLGDCTHALAGQTVALPSVKDEE